MNPADTLNEVTVDIRHPKNGDDVAHFEDVVNFLRNAQPHYGRIKKVKVDGKDGKYQLDIYGDALFSVLKGSDIVGGSIDSDSVFAIGNRVVCYFIDGVAYISGMAFPRGVGQFRVLMIMDTQSPGTMAFDAPRFI